MDKEGGGFVNRPPILDESNYDYWKPRMATFLKSLDNKAWRAANKGWEHPVTTDKDGKSSLKPEEEWSKDEEELALGNSKALNALFNGIDRNIFRLVHHCELAKDVWDTCSGKNVTRAESRARSTTESPPNFICSKEERENIDKTHE